MIGDRIRQGRLAAGFTLAETARRLSAVGGPSTRAALSNYEKNKRVPDAGVLVLLARVLG
ncbi:MAG: helix-turn-helix domain-containing protein, partial [Planctomycetota bacterium]